MHMHHENAVSFMANIPIGAECVLTPSPAMIPATGSYSPSNGFRLPRSGEFLFHDHHGH